jgi:ADP-ribose pyrophosphatase YjhB (NUDIX family)
MRPFVFCPACATKLENPDQSEGGASCPNCGRTWYRNSAPTAGAAIVRDGRVLLAVRGVDPHKGKFDVPGGFLRVGEEPIAGVKREVREETGLEIDVSMEDCLQIVPHEYGGEGDYVLAIGFKARHVSGEPSAASDVADVRWVGKKELDDLDFAWEHDRQLARRALGE